eukprot:s545_g9.t1
MTPALLFLTAAAARACGAGVTVAVPLQRRQRWMEADRWGRRQSTTEYFGHLSLPDEAALAVSFDTGSGNVVLPCAPRKGPRLRYEACNVSESPPESPLTLTFGTGEVNGSYADAPICVGSLCTKLRWVAGWQLSEEPFGQAPFEGVLGLALPALAEGSNFSFFDELVKSRRLEQNVFAIYFPQEPWEDAELLLGGIDEQRMETKLTWVPVSRPGFWQVAVRDLTLDGEDMNVCGSQGSYRSCSIALDSGTSGALAAPSWLARRLAQQLTDCGGEGKRLGFRLEESDLLLELEAADYLPDGCEGALQLMAVDVPAPHGPVMLLGDLFLRKYYTVYDRQRLQIGFTLARHGQKLEIL